MNKATKGAIAAGAAAVLLLGGLGSLALWNDSETLGGGAITSGDLKLSLVANSASWQDVSDDVDVDGDGVGTPIPVIADFRIVPGDTIAYTAQYLIEAEGENLTANLTADTAGVVAGTGSAQLAAAIDTTVTATDANGNVLPTDGQGTTVIESVTTTPQDQTITVRVEFEFDRTTGDAPGTGTNAQNQTIDLAAFTLNLDQIRPVTP